MNEARGLFGHSVSVEDPRKLKEAHLPRQDNLHKTKGCKKKKKVRQTLELGGKKGFLCVTFFPSLEYFEMPNSLPECDKAESKRKPRGLKKEQNKLRGQRRKNKN